MIDKILLVTSVLLNIFLIWDRFKPKGTNLICNISTIKPLKYYLTIKNPNSKLVKISQILLDDEKLSEFELGNKKTKLPIILQSENEITITIYSSSDKGKPSNCKIKVQNTWNPKTIEYSI